MPAWKPLRSWRRRGARSCCAGSWAGRQRHSIARVVTLFSIWPKLPDAFENKGGLLTLPRDDNNRAMCMVGRIVWFYKNAISNGPRACIHRRNTGRTSVDWWSNGLTYGWVTLNEFDNCRFLPDHVRSLFVLLILPRGAPTGARQNEG